jgi:glycerol-3-phosphate cytidylyltransferase
MKHHRALAIGVFDLFHVGHLRYLQYAREQAEQLYVAVAPDVMTHSVKGKWPVIPETERLEIVRGLGWIDSANLQPVSSTQPVAAAQWIQQWGITLVVAGGGWRGSDRWVAMEQELKARAISVIFAPDTPHVSTSALVAAIRYHT